MTGADAHDKRIGLQIYFGKVVRIDASAKDNLVVIASKFLPNAFSGRTKDGCAIAMDQHLGQNHGGAVFKFRLKMTIMRSTYYINVIG